MPEADFSDCQLLADNGRNGRYASCSLYTQVATEILREVVSPLDTLPSS